MHRDIDLWCLGCRAASGAAGALLAPAIIIVAVLVSLLVLFAMIILAKVDYISEGRVRDDDISEGRVNM